MRRASFQIAPVVSFSKKRFPDMKWLQRSRIPAILLTSSALVAAVVAQSTPSARPNEDVALLTSIRALPEGDGPAVEIVATRPVVPTIRKLDNPPRIVVDVPGAQLETHAKRIDVRNPVISSIRLNQFQQNPPIARIVVDLTAPIEYSSESTGNLLLVRFGATESASKAKYKNTSAPVASAAADTVVDGSRLVAGSSVTAGSDAAVVRLGRGGEVRVCPGTTVSVTPSQNNRSLMLGMSTGALEAHYKLDASADSIITPDFRILLPGPGEFHYAVSADARGNTCIQSLAGNSASVIVSELLGDGTYQVKPGDQIILRSGQLKNIALTGSGACGCPAPTSPVVLASSKTPIASATAENLPGSETAALPPSTSKDVHVQVDAPFVFRGDEPNVAQPPAIVQLEGLPLRSPEPSEPLASSVQPPAKPERHGFFGKLKGFFASIFG